ncbi:transcriptional regulator with XRE-family HTH domain [Microbacterium natoriense]|uniref:Transcriptional regulator with XRE-family HTH domain n=1 Tax=Microbacterium natoriense TaxID=284570 RepID=A0AAW8EZI1_9MICO|nr:helix-turn-helix transcriptional regulator [Microbacterium natoriense]MDQ0648653.1 transcriptional regulator with XRE-family HTH domain [Microbacterium natoriense]
MPRTPSPAAAHIGSRIAELRKAQSLSVDGLGYKTGIDSSNIRSYEAGRAMMNVRSLVRIAAALGVEPGALLEGVGPSMFDTDA